MEICKYIVDETNEPNSLYYSIENNTIGEAALISLAEFGESNIPGTMLSEAGKKRKGFNTTHKTKLAACAKFKTLVETKKMKINSFSLISELKAFIASGGSYAAKQGETDDLVMSLLLINSLSLLRSIKLIPSILRITPLVVMEKSFTLLRMQVYLNTSSIRKELK